MPDTPRVGTLRIEFFHAVGPGRRRGYLSEICCKGRFRSYGLSWGAVCHGEHHYTACHSLAAWISSKLVLHDSAAVVRCSSIALPPDSTLKCTMMHASGIQPLAEGICCRAALPMQPSLLPAEQTITSTAPSRSDLLQSQQMHRLSHAVQDAGSEVEVKVDGKPLQKNQEFKLGVGMTISYGGSEYKVSSICAAQTLSLSLSAA